MKTLKSIVLIFSLVCIFVVGCESNSGSSSERPEVVSFLPKTGSLAVPTDTSIIIEFNKEMDKESVKSSYSLMPDTSGVPVFSWNENTLTITYPRPLLSYTLYTIEISSTAESYKGANLKDKFSFSFVTAKGTGTPGGSDIRLDTDSAGAGDSSFPQIAVSDANIYICWWDMRAGTGNADVYFNYSHDAGATWQTNDIKINNGNTNCTWRRSGPMVAASGDNVYVVWYDARNTSNNIYLNYSNDRGETWQTTDTRLDTDALTNADSTSSVIAASGNNVYVAWRDLRNGNQDIYFNCSTDAGKTWKSQDIRINTNAAGVSDSTYTDIACNGDNVYVIFIDNRNDLVYGNVYDMYINCSNDAGETWTEDIRVNTSPAGTGDCYRPTVACADNNVYVAWQDERNGATDIYVNYSNDYGLTWSTNDVRIDRDNSGYTGQERPVVAASGNSVYVTWYDSRNGLYPDAYFNCSHDGGNTWLTNDIRINTNSAGSSESSYPHVACNGDYVCACWCDDRNSITGNRDIYCNYSIDGGITWRTSDIRMNTNTAGSSDCAWRKVACSGSNIFAVWTDDRNNIGGDMDIYFNAVK